MEYKTKQTSPYLTVQSLGGFGLAGTGTHKNSSVLGKLIQALLNK